MVVYSRVEVAESMTAEEFLRDAPEEHKAELIDGVMVMPSPPLDSHERMFSFLFRTIGAYAEELDLGEVRGSRTPVVLAADQAPEPDILFVSKERLDLIQPRGVMGAPDLVIEILSVGTERNDRGPKFRAYQRAGVKELWLIDPYGPAGTEFFQLQDQRFVRILPDEQGRISSITMSGFWLDTTWLWVKDHHPPVSEILSRIKSS